MRMVKSLLLGSAAGLVAVAGAQAADLPVKAKQVEYVKICNLYGDGFYYIPGTDTCIKFAGLAWAEISYGDSSGGQQPTYFGQAGAQDRSTSAWHSRARGDFDIDARTQTSYGTLRSFIRYRTDITSAQQTAFQQTVNNTAGGFTAAGTGANTITNDGTNTATMPRAFIQWAGFTFGHVKSLADPVANYSDFRLLLQGQSVSDTVGGGINEMSYTWELGNGNSISVGVRDRQPQPITNLSVSTPFNAVAVNGVVPGVPGVPVIGAPSVAVGATPTAYNGGSVPNPFATWRLNQSWGQAAVAVLGNLNQATYYTASNNNGLTVGAPAANIAVNGAPGYLPSAACIAQPGTSACTHPGDKWGWSAAASTVINMPWVAPGDRLGAEIIAGQGMMKSGIGNNVNGPGLFGAGNTVGLGVVTDAVFVNGGALQLTNGFSFTSEFEHWWVPSSLVTVFWGSYTQVNYNSTVVNNRLFCGNAALGGAAAANGAAAQGINPATGPSCDPSFSYFNIGVTSSWYVTRAFRLALEVMYTGVNTGFRGDTVALNKMPGLLPVGIYTTKDIGITNIIFRAQRNFGNDII